MSKSIRERDVRSPVLKATITDPVNNKVRFIKTQTRQQSLQTKNVSAGQRVPLSEFNHFFKTLDTVLITKTT